MTHRNARLTPVTRAELVEQVLAGWPQAEVARLFRVSRATVAKWVRRFREAGPDALLDRSSRPLRCPTPDRSAAGSSHLRCTPVFRLGATPHRVAVGHRPFHRLRRPAPCRTPPPRVAPSHHTGDRALRACPPWLAGSPGHQETRPHPAGWRQAHPARLRRDPQRSSARPPPRFRFPPCGRGRPFPLRLRPGPAGRTRRDGCRLPCPGACPLRALEHHRRAHPY